MSISVQKFGVGFIHVEPEFVNIDVTSGSKNLVTHNGVKIPVKSLSPLKGDLPPVTAGDGLVFVNFELWWQSSKIYVELGHCRRVGKTWILTSEFFAWRLRWSIETVGRRRLPGTRGLTPIGAYHDNRIVDYVESRKYYLTHYCLCIHRLPAFRALVSMVESGTGIMVLGFDGPLLDEYPSGHEVSWNFLTQMINRTDVLFGHGYVVAGALLYRTSGY